jgi:hypothetical protein
MTAALDYILAHAGELVGFLCGAIFAVNFIVWLARRIFWD